MAIAVVLKQPVLQVIFDIPVVKYEKMRLIASVYYNCRSECMLRCTTDATRISTSDLLF